MDFQKAFDTVPHRKLLLKLWRYGIRGNIHKWIEGFLTQRKQHVVIDGEFSPWVDVESSVPPGVYIFQKVLISSIPILQHY